VDTNTQKVTVSAEAYFYPGAVCIQMMVPFIKSVELPGQLAAGSYKVDVIGSQTVPTTSLSVARSTRPDADDYLYGAVRSVEVKRGFTGDSELVLRGEHPYLLQGCVKFINVRTYMSDSNVLVVQPITQIVPSEECTAESSDHHFEETVKVEGLTTGEYLIHVRALDGNALNQFVEIDR
jgi:hypothetical protein